MTLRGRIVRRLCTSRRASRVTLTRWPRTPGSDSLRIRLCQLTPTKLDRPFTAHDGGPLLDGTTAVRPTCQPALTVAITPRDAGQPRRVIHPRRPIWNDELQHPPDKRRRYSASSNTSTRIHLQHCARSLSFVTRTWKFTWMFSFASRGVAASRVRKTSHGGSQAIDCAFMVSVSRPTHSTSLCNPHRNSDRDNHQGAERCLVFSSTPFASMAIRLRYRRDVMKQSKAERDQWCNHYQVRRSREVVGVWV